MSSRSLQTRSNFLHKTQRKSFSMIPSLKEVSMFNLNI